ncbi:SUKH-3 domain-containing protein [Pseudomonas fluorescens]|uniref:SUKH-3 immunity protein of toxin-antitoxin system n=1 Tax=Pseudomonas fluorescens TaxID=294 RepID=A0A5E7SDV0_PSEFL|nr:SUKH-3 domain-containing protein [Pseudomonas fluorescens]VVP81483.1 hypothetical protein PS941_00834 [Pseudomonas fluorescens]
MHPLIELPETLQPLFLAAGWPVTHIVPLPDFVPREHPAAALLEQLAGLTVGTCGTGEDCATSDVAFGAFEHLYGDEDFLAWQQCLGSTLVNIAEIHHGHAALLMDEKGRCYAMSFIHDGFWLQGRTFVKAMEKLVFGRKCGEQVALATPGAVPVV